MNDESQVAPRAERVMLVGLDGATWDVLTPLAEMGVMPSLARLMSEAALAKLTSVRPCITPAAWGTLQTGVDPLSHGVLDYRYFDHERRQVLLNSTRRLAAPTLFDLLAARGESVVSLGAPVTWPARVSPPSIVVGGIDCPSIEIALAPYPRFAEALARAGARLSLDMVWNRRPRDLAELRANIAATRQNIQAQTIAAGVADQQCDWRLMTVQYQVLDALQHRAWHLLANPLVAEPHPWSRELHECFAELDRALGALIELANRRRAALVVLSDHGFGEFREKISIRELLRRRGLLTPATRWQRLEYRAARTVWKLRRGATKRLTGNSPRALERPLGSLAALDWRRTRALSLHGAIAGLVYLNTPERFGRGPVDTAGRYDEALAETLAAFREARHHETGEPLFVEAIATRERIDGDPCERGLPDVMAIPADGFHTRSKPDRRPRLLPADPEMAGTHRAEGVLLVRAAGVRTGVRHEAQLRDIAPTALALLGIAPSGMEGSRLSTLWGEAPAEPVARRLGAARLRPMAPGADEESAAAEGRLRALGYIE